MSTTKCARSRSAAGGEARSIRRRADPAAGRLAGAEGIRQRHGRRRPPCGDRRRDRLGQPGSFAGRLCRAGPPDPEQHCGHSRGRRRAARTSGSSHLVCRRYGRISGEPEKRLGRSIATSSARIILPWRWFRSCVWSKKPRGSRSKRPPWCRVNSDRNCRPGRACAAAPARPVRRSGSAGSGAASPCRRCFPARPAADRPAWYCRTAP